MSAKVELLSILCQMGLPTGGSAKPEAVPALLVAGPGVGKTEIVYHISEVLSKHLGNFPTEVFVAPQQPPENISGIPVPDKERKTTELYPLAIGKKLKESGQGILFIDEFSSAPDATAAACLTLIQSGTLGDIKLPPSVARVMAMNDPEKATAGRPLMSAESNRPCWIEYDLELDDWIDYMNGGPGAARAVPILPALWERNFYTQAMKLTTRYLKSMPKDFNCEPEPSKAGQAWPSPRSWRNATRVLAATMSLKYKFTSDVTMAAMSGCVGNSASEGFVNWLKAMDLPDPEDVLADVEKFTLPERDDRLLAVLDSVAACSVQDNPDLVKRWQTACRLVDRVAEAKKGDLTLDVVKFLLHKIPAGAAIPNTAGAWYKMMKDMSLLTK